MKITQKNWKKHLFKAVKESVVSVNIPLERVFKRSLMRRLKERGGFWYSTEMRGLAGIPDIVGCRDGLFIGIECKRSSKYKPTRLQAYNLDKIRLHGGFAMVAHPGNVAEVMAKLEQFLIDRGCLTPIQPSTQVLA